MSEADRHQAPAAVLDPAVPALRAAWLALVRRPRLHGRTLLDDLDVVVGVRAFTRLRMPHRPIQRDDPGDDTVDLVARRSLVRLHVPGRLFLHRQIVDLPTHTRIATMPVARLLRAALEQQAQ